MGSFSVPSSGLNTSTLATGNKYIKCIIKHKITRYESSYKVSYSVYMKRTNSWSGTPTNGTINYKIYVNGSTVKTGTNSNFTVKNNNSECLLVSGEKIVNLKAFNSSTYTIGYSSTGTSGITAFANSTTRTIDKVNVPAYATSSGVSQIMSITDTGKNGFNIKLKVGADGTNNSSRGCKVWWTTNGTTPSPENHAGDYTLYGDAGTVGYTGTIPVTSRVTVKAIVYTLYADGYNADDDGAVYTKSDVSTSGNIIYYSAPTISDSSVKLKFSGASKSTPRALYTAEWGRATNGSGNTLKGYQISLSHNDISIPSFNLAATVVSADISKILADNNIALMRGDTLRFSVRPYTEYGDGDPTNRVPNTILPGEWVSRTITIESAGVVRVKTPSGWKEGRVFVKTPTQWVEATGVYVKTPSGWKESI